jgi:hypothetical protein
MRPQRFVLRESHEMPSGPTANTDTSYKIIVNTGPQKPEVFFGATIFYLQRKGHFGAS